jgi:diguanylate cyclase (GGDEF)-like protein/PAS domain S-box-containing protein
MNGPPASEHCTSDPATVTPGGADRPERRLRWALHSVLLVTALAMATAGALHAVVGAVLSLTVALGVVEPAVRFWRRQHQRLAGEATQLERLALVAERTNNLVIITDAARRIVWANEAFVRASGYTLAEAVGRKPAELLQTTATDPTTVQTMRAAMDAGQGVRVELLNRSKGGTDYWLDIDIQPLHDPSGTLTGFLAVETDITAQVFQRQRLRTLFDALPAGVIEQDASGAIVDGNRAAEQVLGQTHDQLRGRTSLDGHWQTVREDLSPYPGEDFPIARSLREGISVRADSMGLLTPHGEQRWLFVNSDPLRNAAGVVTGAVACFVDVTEQRTQRILLQLALKAADIGTWQWRVDTDEREWSEASCAMLGYTALEFKPLLATWRERIHPEDRARFHAVLNAHLMDQSLPYRCEVRVSHREGHWVWVHILGTVVELDQAGQMRRMVGVQIDISDRKRQEQQLQVTATTDSLTGLPNRAALMARLQHTIDHRDDGSDRHFALLFLDFDRFKQVNDNLGHAAGDELLRQIALRLLGALRPIDDTTPGRSDARQTAARLGGDEFVVLLDGLARPHDACGIAERLLQVLARPYEVLGHRVHSSASIGVVTSAHAFDGADSLLRDADTAMYEAKQGGRGRWVMFEPRMHEQVSRRASVEADLHDALERDELFVVYQPVLALDDPQGERGCAGVEALVRWRHPERGIVPPVQFISVAEESGLIGALGQFVLRSACRQFMRWRLTLGDRAPAMLAVNLSIAQLRQGVLLDEVRRALADSAMPAASLQLEVTESLAAQDPLVQSRLRDLKALGVKLALDDFGTGYSSLACLHQLPVDTVKIDRSFVVEAERSEYHRALIEATIRVARTLRMTTVAEGIETTGQAALITSLGCDRGQGYLYSRPLEADALSDWLAARAPLCNVINLPVKPRPLTAGS